MKNPGEIRPPGGDFFLVAHCVEVSRNQISFALLDDPLLDRRRSSEVRPKSAYMSDSKRVLVMQLTSLAG